MYGLFERQLSPCCPFHTAETPSATAAAAAKASLLHRKRVIVDMSCVSFCDASGVAALEAVVGELGKCGIETLFANLTAEVAKSIAKSQSTLIRDSNMYLSIGEAVRKCRDEA